MPGISSIKKLDLSHFWNVSTKNDPVDRGDVFWILDKKVLLDDLRASFV